MLRLIKTSDRTELVCSADQSVTWDGERPSQPPWVERSGAIASPDAVVATVSALDALAAARCLRADGAEMLLAFATEGLRGLARADGTPLEGSLPLALALAVGKWVYEASTGVDPFGRAG